MAQKRFSTSSSELHSTLIAQIKQEANERIKATKALLSQIESGVDTYRELRQTLPDLIDQVADLGTMTKNQIIEAFDIPKELATRPRQKKTPAPLEPGEYDPETGVYNAG